MMICPKCKSENVNNTSECWQCGEKIGIPLPIVSREGACKKNWKDMRSRSDQNWLRRLPTLFRISAYLSILTLPIYLLLVNVDSFVVFFIFFLFAALAAILNFIFWMGMAQWVETSIQISAEVRQITENLKRIK